MRVAIVGAGIIGVTTAYELAADGHEVTVFERRGSVAAEASFANAGLVAPGHLALRAAPGGVLGRLLNRRAPLRLRPGLDPAAFAWLWRWWQASRARTARATGLQCERLAYFSRERLHRLRQDLKLDYERSDGCLVLLRAPKDLDSIGPGLAQLTELKARFETLDAQACLAVEPGLNAETALHAGIYLPDDEVGNCRQFAHLLRAEAQRLGARFRFHTRVHTVRPGRAPQLGYAYEPPADSAAHSVQFDSAPNDAQDTQPLLPHPEAEDFDAIVVCAAPASRALLRRHGLKLPVHTVFGYSITAPLRRHESHPDVGPRSALIDERHQVTITRLGARVRVSGGVEFGGSAARLDDGVLKTLYLVLHDWFPGSARLTQAQRWKGARATLPDGPPVLGPSGIDGVWLNLGHGDHGWAMACGSARLLADSVAGRPTVIQSDGLGVGRLKG